jgi:N-acetyl-gamma-glutamyl-phosphate reductase
MKSNVIRVAVVGATGYSGAELAALLSRHPGAEIVGVFSSGVSGNGGQRKGSSATSAAATFSTLHPTLRGVTGPQVLPYSLEALDDAAVVFLATPNEASAEIAPAILETGAAVIDLSGAFRLRDAALYPEWYGFTHPAPHLLEDAVYGLTEHCNGELAGARLVANPGCYPTAAALALRPLAGLLDAAQPVICDAKSGVSGAGKRSEVVYSFTELSGNFKAYGTAGHRHAPEIRVAGGLDSATPFVFVPHLLPVPRGILVTLYLGFAEAQTEEALVARYAGAYGDAPLVRVLPAGTTPELRDVVGTPYAEIGFSLIDGGRRAVVVSVIDNLLKGAASQAVQNFNRMCGFAETEGLV